MKQPLNSFTLAKLQFLIEDFCQTHYGRKFDKLHMVVKESETGKKDKINIVILLYQ